MTVQTQVVDTHTYDRRDTNHSYCIRCKQYVHDPSNGKPTVNFKNGDCSEK